MDALEPLINQDDEIEMVEDLIDWEGDGALFGGAGDRDLPLGGLGEGVLFGGAGDKDRCGGAVDE